MNKASVSEDSKIGGSTALKFSEVLFYITMKGERAFDRSIFPLYRVAVDGDSVSGLRLKIQPTLRIEF